MAYEYCSHCGESIETKEETCWKDGEPFCSEGCVETQEEENGK